MTPSPWHLWAGDWRADSQKAHEAVDPERIARSPAEAEQPPPPEQPPATAHRRRRGMPRRAPIVLAIAVLSAGAFGVGTLVNGGDDPAALPAASNEIVNPRQGQTRAGAVYAAASPAVVSVRTNGGTGTGFLVSSDGRIVTNAHVVDEGESVMVRFGSDGDSIDANVLGTDSSSDLAVLSIDGQSVPAGVKPLRLADSNTVRVGDLAIAIGNPFGLDRTATEGIVSGIGREIQAPNGFSIDSVIQTDAPINPGNSGGPLLDGSGRVIGVNSQIETSGSQGNVGIGFAVPSNTVREVVPVLAQGKTIKRPYLGLQSSASASGRSGAEVQNVISGGPSDQAGIRQGDVITRVDGAQVREPSDVLQAIDDNKPGDEVQIEIQRKGSDLTLTATLGTRPAQAAQTP